MLLEPGGQPEALGAPVLYVDPGGQQPEALGAPVPYVDPFPMLTREVNLKSLALSVENRFCNVRILAQTFLMVCLFYLNCYEFLSAVAE